MKYDFVYLAVGAVIAVYIRYKVTGANLFIGNLPVSVLLINILGSFVLGASSAAITELGLDSRYTLLVGVGFCGTLTTMSSFAFETANFVALGRLLTAALDIAVNVGASILAIFLGRALILLLIG
jgi:fluoride exporter